MLNMKQTRTINNGEFLFSEAHIDPTSKQKHIARSCYILICNSHGMHFASWAKPSHSSSLDLIHFFWSVCLLNNSFTWTASSNMNCVQYHSTAHLYLLMDKMLFSCINFTLSILLLSLSRECASAGQEKSFLFLGQTFYVAELLLIVVLNLP